MGINYNPSIVTRNLLLNLDFGNIQKCYNGSENLVSYSNYNAATWSNIFPANATITTGIDAPDGTNTAVRLTCAATGSSLLRVGFPSFTPNGINSYTTSFYVRLISGTTSSSNLLTTDLADGTPTGNYLPSLIANRWVRVSFSGVPTVTAKSFIDLLSDNTNNYVLDFWGVQVERGVVASPIVTTSNSTVTRPTTATSTISNYSHTINQPQYISYDGTNNSIRFDRNETFANFTGSITSNVLTVTAMSGITTITNGSALSYSGLTPTRYITSFGTGIGTTGTYNVNAGIDTTSRAMTAAYKIGGSMSVITSGALASNTYLYNDHTTEVWARINDRTGGNYDGYEFGSVLVVFAGFHSMFLYDPSALYYTIWDNTGTTQKNTSVLTLGTSGTDIIQGQWFQVVVTKSGSTFKTYLNGVLKKTDTITSTAFSGVTNRLAFGSAYDGNTGAFYYYAKNDVGCLKMYNATLSADEISQNFNATRGRYGI